MEFSDHFKNLYQSYIIESSDDQIENRLLSVLEEIHGVDTANNPDLVIYKTDSFSIASSRELKERASMNKSGAGKRVFIINTGSITTEASNALLKTLEEPGEDTFFFIIIPKSERIPQTIFSRSRLVKDETSGSKALSAEEFLRMPAPKRISFIKELMARHEKDDISRSDIQIFIDDIIKTSKESVNKEILAVAAYSTDQSASLKMVLEYLALSINM